MTQRSIFWTTDGTGDGINSGYTQDNITEFVRALFTGRTANAGGAASDYLNELAVSGTSSPVSIATGGGVAYGFLFVNTATETLVIPTPVTSTRIDRVVLRADWATRTVRLTRVAGTEGGGAPALTQSAGTTWDVPLAQASITTGGVITVTDQREWLGLLGDGAVSEAKLAAGLLGPTVLYIPFIAYMANAGAGGGIGFASASYIQSYPEIEITKEHFPSTCTVKLVVLISGGTTNLKSIDLYNVTTAATVTSSEVTSTSNAGLVQLKSSDFRANLAAGANRYAVRGKKASGTLTVLAAYLLVEW